MRSNSRLFARRVANWVVDHRKNIPIVLLSLLYPIIITLFMNYIGRDSAAKPLENTLLWVTKYPVAFLINCLLVFMMSALIWFISRKLPLAVILPAVLSVAFSLANYFKLTIRGEPVYPGDLLFPGEVTNIVGATKLIIPSSAIIFGAIMLAIFIASFFVKSPRLRRRKRLLFAILTIAIMALSFPLYFANTGVQKALGIEDAIWNQRYNYQKNGFYNAFFMQTKYLIVDKPSGYSKQTAKKILAKSTSSESIANTPNIIVIMTESFWDPTKLPNVKYDVDPMTSFKQVQQESIYGNLLVEPFGGNTANTEFEVLTGFSMSALPGGVAYQQYVKHQLPSLASLLKAQGYTTEAIHPYEPWFWNRKAVYPLLGIDKFLTRDSFSDSSIKGSYVSDQAVGDKIISEYESSRSGNQPFFAHVVTMQNHGWYKSDRYGDQQQVHASSDDLSDAAILELNTYAQGVKDAGDNIARLTQYFKTIDEPTYIVFFGDHLPTLGGDYSDYRKTGYISKGELSDDDLYKLHTTPFLIWSNTSTAGKDVGTINANYLTPLVLKSAGITMSSYFSYLDSQMDEAKACNKTVCLESDGSYVKRSDSKVTDKLTKQSILQYYYLFESSN